MADLGPLVLLVEDEPQMRRFLRTTLRAHDCQVVEAGTAREALAQAAGRNPDLILLDLGLPDGDDGWVLRSAFRVRFEHVGHKPTMAVRSLSPMSVIIRAGRRSLLHQRVRLF